MPTDDKLAELNARVAEAFAEYRLAVTTNGEWGQAWLRACEADAARRVALAPPKVIELTSTEVLSGLDRVRWAEGLIRQLPESHKGRNSWLLNFGVEPAPPKTHEAEAVASVLARYCEP